MAKNHEINKIDVLILISFGVLEYENGEYFGKNAVINYAHEISKHFSKTYFLCNIHKNKNYFNTKLNTNKVEPIEIGIESQNNSLNLIDCLLRDQVRLARLVTKKTAVIINSPDIWFTPILPFLAIKSGHLSGYMAGNPWGIAKLQSLKGGIGNIIKSKITILYGKLIIAFSDSLLVRGDTFRYQKHDDKVYESKPIILLSKQSQVNMDRCNTENITLLYVGGLYKNKGIDVLLSAFSNLVNQNNLHGKNMRLKIIGDGEEYMKLRTKAQELNIDNKTEFFGYIDNQERLAKEYISSDIFILPTLVTEACPRVVDEAMNYGVPVISTDHGFGASFEHKKNVFFVKPGSVTELEKAIEEIINNSELRRKMIENGKKRIGNIMMEDSAAAQHARIVKGKLSDRDYGAVKSFGVEVANR